MFHLMKLIRRINLFFARCLSRGGKKCCRCWRYRHDLGVCNIYFLHQEQTFMMRTSPWDSCIIGDLEGNIEMADLDELKLLKEKEEQNDEAERKRRAEEESPEPQR